MRPAITLGSWYQKQNSPGVEDPVENFRRFDPGRTELFALFFSFLGCSFGSAHKQLTFIYFCFTFALSLLKFLRSRKVKRAPKLSSSSADILDRTCTALRSCSGGLESLHN